MAEQSVVYEKPKSVMNRKGTSDANNRRIEQDEKELEELLKAQEEPKEEEQEGSQEEEKLSAEEKSFKKRYGDLRRHMDKTVKDLETKIEKLQKQPKNAPPASEDDVEQWMKENPKIASIVESIADRKAKEKFSEANERLSKLDEEKYELTREKAEDTIRKVHKDFDTLRDSEEFHTWAEDQPKWVQDALYENADDAKSVIRVIDLFKLDNKNKSSDVEAAMEVRKGSASVPKEGKKKGFSESQVARMSQREYDKLESEIMESMQTGTFVYDISGAS